MGGLILANYQRRAIDELVSSSLGLIKGDFDVDNNLIVFAAPTGSGKTVMLTKYIEEMVDKESDISFIWFSPGDGDLIEQSYKSVKRNISNKIKCTLVESKKGRLEINNKEIFFLNWEKVNKTNNKLNRGGDLPTFKETINRSVDKGRKIVVIIDEFHFKGASERADKFLDSLNYDVKMGVSATPKIESNVKVVVNKDDVIKEGFIKEKVTLNAGINVEVLRDDIQDLNGIEYSESDFDLLMCKAFEKRLEIKNAYIKEGYDVNPLVLIQIPNGAMSTDLYKKEILSFLEKRGVGSEKLAWHFAGDIRNNTDLDGKNRQVEFFIFKQAIATGWDCPRSHVLVRFRDVSSESFNIQTLGRILRVVNPTSSAYKSSTLRKAYMYTNSISTVNDVSQIEEDFVVEETELKGRFNEFTLPSYGYEQLDKLEVDEMFVIDRIEKYLQKEYSFASFRDRKEHNLSQLRILGWNISFKSYSEILTQQDIHVHDEFEKGSEDHESVLEVGSYVVAKRAIKDLEMEYEKFLSSLTTSLRTLERVQVDRIVKNFIHSITIGDEDRRYRSLAFVCENKERIKNLFLEVFEYVENYSGVKNKIVNKDFKLPESLDYKTNTFKKSEEYDLPPQLREAYAYGDYYVKDPVVVSEDSFVKNLANYISHIRKIKMWWKNLDSGGQGFSIKYEIDGFEQLTYPDYLIEFDDGTVGIFEVKGEQEFSKWSKVKLETRCKMDAISEYISRLNIEDPGRVYIGGVVASNQGRLKLYLHSDDIKGVDLNKYVMENFTVGTDLEEKVTYPKNVMVKLNYLELVLKVLNLDGYEKLSSKEVWDIATENGWVDMLEHSSKTPSYSLSTRMIMSYRNGVLDREKIEGVWKYSIINVKDIK